MIKFEKVSYDQFEKDCRQMGFKCSREIYDRIKLPARSTSGSAGYDFFSPFDFTLGRVLLNKTTAVGASGKEFVTGRPVDSFRATIPTGVRVILPKGKFLMCVPRSSLGIKYNLHLANTIGIIDSDYSGAENEGHIMCCLEQEFVDLGNNIKSGEKFMQGIIMNYNLCDEDSSSEKRTGGLGSTGK